ncbi:Dyp-type peroxidase [Niveibacterium terrae]|uniref:Dyp-type peroxidase n=1 Tax=Niveibacterium terrae TaxID=3373598 RepID=UPI003A8D777D
MAQSQSGILAPLPKAARYLAFSLKSGADPRAALARLAAAVDGEATVAGLGESLVTALDARIEGLKSFPALAAPGLDIPSTQTALWLWLRGEDRGELLHRGQALAALLDEAFGLEQALDAFLHAGGRDLSGFEDGTENPKDEAALSAAIVSGEGNAPAGSSFVAVQQWLHDLRGFAARPAHEQNMTIGRDKESNEELEDAPESAHVKRTAQEDFEPEAFVLRRSMPWIEGERAGLVFVAFGASLAAFEAQLRRMSGQEDGIRDALFSFTHPVTGAYYWCPPVVGAKLDLSALGL